MTKGTRQAREGAKVDVESPSSDGLAAVDKAGRIVSGGAFRILFCVGVRLKRMTDFLFFLC